MSHATLSDTGIEHVCYYGELALPGSTHKGTLPPDFTMNSPIGIHQDNYGHVWVCDTGNSRVLVFSPDLDTLLHVIDGPGAATPDQPRWLMPFHLCPHPTDDLMYCTDLGNGRVVAYRYDRHSVSFGFTFGGADDGINGAAGKAAKAKTKTQGKASAAFTPLSDPNGITVVRESSGDYFIYVCDEFFHTKDDQRSRCVKFTLDGLYVSQFRGVTDPKNQHDLMWPQGIASDSKGNLYIANTGSYEILKISTDWPIEDGCVISPRDAVLMHSFGNPSGIGKFNVMRSVCVIDDHVFVPGQVENAISIYSPQGKLQATVAGLQPLWNHNPEVTHSMSDLVYGMLEDSVFVGPYQVCAGKEQHTYYISEPFASTVLKVEIPQLEGGVYEEALLLDAVGHRRDGQAKKRATSQFNCMTAVLGIDPARRAANELAQAGASWIDTWATAGARVYQYWYDQFRAASGFDPLARVGQASLNIDSGNWCMKTYSTSGDPMLQLPDMMRGFFVPGDLAMAAYYPAQALLGQICPGTPLLFVTNFNTCTVAMYQFSPTGHLLNYGLPFGRSGVGGEGTLKAPQGIAVNSRGEIFIADSLNNRISKWKIQPTGLVSFVKNFRWQQDGKEQLDFTPCDVAVDARDRVYVCDQFNDCLRAFDSEGNSLWSYGQRGYCDNMDSDYGNFLLPASLCIDGEHLIVNDLVNRALKIFEIEDDGLKFVTGKIFFKEYPEDGGVWMPYFIYSRDRRVYVPDTTFNVVNVFDY